MASYVLIFILNELFIFLYIMLYKDIIAGYDIAFYKNGYRYHTKFDEFSKIPLESFQHAGDNALALLLNLDKAPELKEPIGKKYDKVVFYDFLGFIMLDYSMTVAIIINSLTMVVSVGISYFGVRLVLGKKYIFLMIFIYTIFIYINFYRFLVENLFIHSIGMLANCAWMATVRRNNVSYILSIRYL